MSLYTRIRKVYRLLRDREQYFTYKEKYENLPQQYLECKQAYENLRPFNKVVPIGHYESPYPSEAELEAGYNKGFDDKLQGIDLNEQAQLSLYENLKTYAEECPMADKEKNENYRFYDFGDNIWFGRDDARYLYAILMHFKPKNVIEIGSGFSTSLMLDTNEILNHSMNLLCIEPRAQRLKSLLRAKDNLKIIEQDVQNVSLEIFSKLEGGGGDMLFIDSSHLCRPFGDVNRELFEILPSLKKGVIVHFHDIIYPFEYPKVWTLEQRRAYNEAYILRAFLQYNKDFEILFWGSFLCNRSKIKDYGLFGGGSIYLRKKG
ncbi:class I SAM-dependent methyltransferase [Helicobacter sp.]|uniref:class I SAM-dependent methyltransferase n=1 Tax=Helicobacter sp. TaxID=218 RepID=UPI0019A371D0|nr:class I SAM-dependent methyltransferase [Helicobacter sp.]MBD5165663.1 class I SAM-dependent methyltransferase [Helicobacter sp.]